MLQRQLGIRRYETAWMILHKLRRAMINNAREPLWGEVELDETWVGGTQAGLKGSRQLKGRKAVLVLVAVERRGRGTGRVRMEVIPDFSGATIREFAARNVRLGATIFTDGLKSFAGLAEAGYRHRPRTQPTALRLRQGERSVVPLVDRAIGNLQNWLVGTSRNPPWSEPRAASGLPRRVCVPPQPARETRGRFPDPPLVLVPGEAQPLTNRSNKVSILDHPNL